MLQNYETIPYKEKMNEQRQERINNLLLILPSYCSDYELYLRNTAVTKTRLEYLQDVYTFFRYLCIKNPYIKEPKGVELSMLEKLNGHDFDEYSSWLVDYKFDTKDETEKLKHNSKVTRKRKFMSLKSFFRFLYIRDYIFCNPSEKATVPTVKKKKRKNITILEDTECEAFLRAIDDEIERSFKKVEELSSNEKNVPKMTKIAPYLAIRDKAIVYLFLGTGLRVSELCAIDRADISPLGYINVIRKEDSDDEKTSDKVYLGDEVKKILNYYISNAREEIGAKDGYYDALFLSSKNERISTRGVELMIKKYADRALGTGNKIVPHSLRATFGTRYYSMTKNISATSTVMNHSSIEVTAAYYLKEESNAKEMGANVPI